MGTLADGSLPSLRGCPLPEMADMNSLVDVPQMPHTVGKNGDYRRRWRRARLPPDMTAPTPTPTLTPRLRQVLSLVAEGYTTAEIARELKLSRHTVKNYMERIFERLGARDRTDAVAIALREGILE